MIAFRLSREYKGGHDQSLQLLDAGAGTDCAFGKPTIGESFFVYGFKGSNRKIYLHACTRMEPLKSAG